MDYPDLEKEIIILCPSKLDIAYERIKESKWFQSDYQKHLKIFPKDWLAFAEESMKESLEYFKNYGFKVYEIDT